MNLIKRIFLITILIISFASISWNIQQVNATTDVTIKNIWNWDDFRNDELNRLNEGVNNQFQVWTSLWAKWIFYTLVNVAQSLKNLFFWLATIFFLIIAIKLLVSENTEEESWKFKKGIIWITAWLIIMQIAYLFVLTLYSKSIWAEVAISLVENMIKPFISLMEVSASIFFLAVAIFAFYRMITANWNEEEAKKAKMSILYAIMWFVLIKIAKVIVDWVYWKLGTSTTYIGIIPIESSSIGSAEIYGLSTTILNIINWLNTFIWIITLLLIIYAWFNILLSAWNEEKIKKAKQSIIYIIIWLTLLVLNYIILSFFL